MGRRTTALAALILATVVAGSLPATASSSAEADFVARINAARRSRGLRALVVKSDLVSVARRHSARMAADETIYHNPNVWTQVDGWKSLAENVGRGRTVAKIQDGFMASPEHRDNILWSAVNEVGVGVVTGRDGKLYVTQIFAGGRSGGTTSTVRAPQRSSSTGSSTPATVAPAPKPAAPKPTPITVQMLAEVVRLG